METRFVVFRHFIKLNHRTTYSKMFGTSRCLRFYPRLCPLGSSSRFDYFSRLLSSAVPAPSTASKELTVEEQLEKLRINPFYEKYAAKIETLQKEDPEQFRTLLSKLVASSTNNLVPKLDKVEAEKVTAPLSPMQAHDSTPSPMQAHDSTPSPIQAYDSAPSPMQEKVIAAAAKKVPEVKEEKPTGLDAIVKLELMKKLSAEDIKELWVKYYADKDAVCAVIPADSYQMIKVVFETFPMFVYPIPRGDGFEIFIGQFERDVLHFTSLHNYQKLQEFAPDQLTLHHYTELQAEKEVVLMSGYVIDDGVSVSDAQMLCYLVQYYCVNHPNLMRDFNRDPGNFSIDRVLAALDMTELLEQNKQVD